MLKLAANLSFLYQEVPFLDRFAAAARDGFKGVEYLFPYGYPAPDLYKRLEDNGLSQILFNLSPGDWEAGERGMASLPARKTFFEQSVRQALDYAAELDCTNLHIMAGLRDLTIPYEEQRAHYLTSLAKAADLARPYGITLLIEPINTVDIPGYFLNDFDEAIQILSEIGENNLKLQFDIYHCQRIHGNVAARLASHLPETGHIQIANPPGRNEPDLGELNYRYLFQLLEEKRYSGWIGCEYKPSKPGSSTLDWARSYLMAHASGG